MNDQADGEAIIKRDLKSNVLLYIERVSGEGKISVARHNFYYF